MRYKLIIIIIGMIIRIDFHIFYTYLDQFDDLP